MKRPIKILAFVARPAGLKLLEALLDDARFKIIQIVTHQMKPKSEDPKRGERPEFAKFTEISENYDIPMTVVNFKREAPLVGLELLRQRFDMVVSCSYRYAIPMDLIRKASLGAINLHRGKLPQLAGAEPVKRALENGWTQVTLTAHKLEQKIDAGEVLAEYTIPASQEGGESLDQAVERIKDELVPHYYDTLIEAIKKLEPETDPRLIQPSYKAVLFDLDGTLANSLQAMFKIYTTFMKGRNLKPSVDEFAELNGPPIPEIMGILKERYKLPDPIDQLIAGMRDAVSKSYATSVEPMPGMEEVLKHLKKMNVMAGIVTSSARSVVDQFLKKNWLTEFIDVIVDHTQTQKGKPDPSPYLRGALEVKAQRNRLLAVEDSSTGLTAARLAGLDTLWFGQNAAQPIDILLAVNARTCPHVEAADIQVVTTHRLPPKHLLKVEVDALWAEARKANPKLTDSQVGIVNQVVRTPDGLQVHLSPVAYSIYYAEHVKVPEDTNLRTLGVSGIVTRTNDEGVCVFMGKRASDVTSYPGFWECVPAGTVQPGELKSGEHVNFKQTLVNEFHEETGLPKEAVQSVFPYELVYDFRLKCYDILCHLEIDPKADLNEAQSDEYEEFGLLPVTKLRAWLMENFSTVVPSTIHLLEAQIPKE